MGHNHKKDYYRDDHHKSNTYKKEHHGNHGSYRSNRGCLGCLTQIFLVLIIVSFIFISVNLWLLTDVLSNWGKYFDTEELNE